MRRLLPLFLIAVSLLILIPPPARAVSSFMGYDASNIGSSTCGANCEGPGSVTAGMGEIFKAPISGQIVSVSLFTGSALPSKVLILTASGQPTNTGYGCGGTPSATCF